MFGLNSDTGAKPNGSSKLVNSLVRKLFVLTFIALVLAVAIDAGNAYFGTTVDSGWIKNAFSIFSGAFLALIDPKAIVDRITHHTHEPPKTTE